MVSCFAADCKHNSESNTCRYFRFPDRIKHEHVYKIWTSMSRPDNVEPKAHSRLCSCHFKDGLHKIEKEYQCPVIFVRNETKIIQFEDPDKRTRSASDVSYQTVSTDKQQQPTKSSVSATYTQISPESLSSNVTLPTSLAARLSTSPTGTVMAGCQHQDRHSFKNSQVSPETAKEQETVDIPFQNFASDQSRVPNLDDNCKVIRHQIAKIKTELTVCPDVIACRYCPVQHPTSPCHRASIRCQECPAVYLCRRCDEALHQNHLHRRDMWVNGSYEPVPPFLTVEYDSCGKPRFLPFAGAINSPEASTEEEKMLHLLLVENSKKQNTNIGLRRWERRCTHEGCPGINHNSAIQCKTCNQRVKRVKIISKEKFNSTKQSSTKLKDNMEKRANQLWAAHDQQILIMHYSVNAVKCVNSHYTTPGLAMRFWEKMGSKVNDMWTSFMSEEVDKMRAAKKQNEDQQTANPEQN